MNGFKELGLTDEILRVIEELGYDKPTDIQRRSVPHILQGRDVIAGSATGSGKTLAFGAGIIQNMEKDHGIKALILTPTRELAIQILDVLKNISKYKNLHVTAIYGGVAINPQFKALERADIVVGTPGRILDHMQRQTIDLSMVKHLVLDEADRMLDMGFFDDVRKIMSVCPKKKQTMLFSATILPEIVDLSKRFMYNPVSVSAETYVDPRKMKQIYYDVHPSLKFSLLVHMLKEEEKGLVMVFCNSRKYTDIVADNLNRSGVEAMAIHGGLTQQKRDKVITKFHSKTVFVLVCTDVAARGLDIPNVSHVYNYDIPKDSKQYIHRIGRTARAGKSGKVINLLSDADHENFGRVLRDNDIEIERADKPYIKKLELSSKPGGRRDDGRRGSPDRRGFGSRPSRTDGSDARPRRFSGRKPARRIHYNNRNRR